MIQGGWQSRRTCPLLRLTCLPSFIERKNSWEFCPNSVRKSNRALFSLVLSVIGGSYGWTSIALDSEELTSWRAESWLWPFYLDSKESTSSQWSWSWGCSLPGSNGGEAWAWALVRSLLYLYLDYVFHGSPARRGLYLCNLTYFHFDAFRLSHLCYFGLLDWVESDAF